jgi:HSP20 family protein
MAEEATRLPVKTEESKAGRAAATAERRPFESLKREIDHLFEDFGISSWRVPFTRPTLEAEPFWRGELSWSKAPAVDIVDKNNALEVTAELPGMDVNDIEVKFADGMLTIRGEKTEAREENKKDHYLSERRYGSFSRSFRIPSVVDADRIEANFKNGVLTVTLPKSPEAQTSEKKIAIRQS